jgi:hypothetical protein
MSQYHWIAVIVFLFIGLLVLAKRQPRADRDFIANRPTLDPRPAIR